MHLDSCISGYPTHCRRREKAPECCFSYKFFRSLFNGSLITFCFRLDSFWFLLVSWYVLQYQITVLSVPTDVNGVLCLFHLLHLSLILACLTLTVRSVQNFALLLSSVWSTTIFLLLLQSTSTAFYLHYLRGFIWKRRRIQERPLLLSSFWHYVSFLFGWKVSSVFL